MNRCICYFSFICSKTYSTRNWRIIYFIDLYTKIKNFSCFMGNDLNRFLSNGNDITFRPNIIIRTTISDLSSSIIVIFGAGLFESTKKTRSFSTNFRAITSIPLSVILLGLPPARCKVVPDFVNNDGLTSSSTITFCQSETFFPSYHP